MPTRCKHRRSWLLFGGLLEWCYQCGAFRNMEATHGGNAIYPESPWCYPTGPNGDNPFNEWNKRKASYLMGRETRRANR